MLIFDCETNGLLHELDRLHCLVIKDSLTGETTRYNDQNNGQHPIVDGILRLQHAAAQGIPLVGHNIIKFDVPALRKVYPWFAVDPKMLLDTMVLARLVYPDLWDIDKRLKAKGTFPGKLSGRHSLEAWGYRLSLLKGEYSGGWEKWNQEMEDYNVQDVVVTEALLIRLQGSKIAPAQEAVDLEMAVQWILARQERHGFPFNVEKAQALYVKLAKRRLELEATLRARFKPFYVPAGYLCPKRDNKKQGYVESAGLTKVKLVEFNPGSRDHVANRLTRLYGWKPVDFTDDGKPKVDEGVLKGLPYPEAKVLEEYFTVEKRIGQLAEGKEAWLKHVKEDGRIHGSVNPNGACTGRMTHAYPNVAQVPANRSPYGEECRALFHASKGKVLVGADADALELRCLAHFMAKHDDGAYVRVVVEGKKEDGTDIHRVNMRALEIDSRDDAKTWFYAFIYGAGNEKLGFIIIKVRNKSKCVKRGKAARESFLRNLPALKSVIESVQKAAKKRGGYLRGLDGRWLQVRSDHAALNTLLQSAGAVLMKRALVILDTNLQEKGYVPGINYEFVANVHDEWQIECDEAIADDVGRMAEDAIRLAGESFGFRCPLAGQYNVGRTWADTH